MKRKKYGRGQVEWSLWRCFGYLRFPELTDAPKMFRTRIKRLLEIDRELDLSETEEPPTADFAFAPLPSDETGEVSYRAEDAFCLSIALDLLDAGFKQAEIVYLMRYMREELAERFAGLLLLPSMLDRQRHFASAHPGVPSYEQNGHRYADSRVFAIIRKVEITEVAPSPDLRESKYPVFVQPTFCAGIEELATTLGKHMPWHRRSVTVLEITTNAQAIAMFLEEAPIIRRGRPRKSS